MEPERISSINHVALAIDPLLGYGTEEHLEAIKKHGVCPEHRRSFGPIREVLELAGGA